MNLFKDIKYFTYDDYWKHRGLKIRTKLREREIIFINWVKSGSSILDIACGDSPLLYELKKQKNCRVQGFDISVLIIEEQKKVGIPALAQDITDDSYELNDNYDYIILSEVLEHLALPEKLIEKIKNKTKYLVISIPNSGFYRFRLRLLFSGRFFKQWAHHPSEHLRFWSHLDFLDWLEAMDLTLIKCHASNGLTIGPIKLYNFWKNLFGHQICYLVKLKQ
ncbi:MAG: hypothetical protein A3J62_02080 [Candidatus Buchananbacteria bacterium RIFCSPHIGHO2_02_FULL_38_8]|uniref:Methionine biosynthesis protein MetW n=1 Tax=Candidatus Buchananbacteria bacterium RIFCSPHIGHO2_02_FULL_38_8 TaxID=1797538 RepID=A0A1G1Y3L6_9BACT|nr:MAG: hypothetical protein A3J62_02080 [Candidatus Buchananbacteria bacterium RIFCSPHIGHO2_02_FULL_38_8]